MGVTPRGPEFYPPSDLDRPSDCIATQTPSGHARRHVASPPPPIVTTKPATRHTSPPRTTRSSHPTHRLDIMSPYASLEFDYANEPGSSRLYPRKGSGGKGGGSSGKGGGSSSSSSSKGSSSKGSDGGSSSGTEKSVPISGSTGGRSTATAYGFGGGKATTIPAGQLFAGRVSGGGTRDQVYGSR